MDRFDDEQILRFAPGDHTKQPMPNQSEIPITLLAIGMDRAGLRMIQEVLGEVDLGILVTADAEGGVELVARMRPPIVLLDVSLRTPGGMDLLERILAAAPETAVIVLTDQVLTDQVLTDQAPTDQQSAECGLEAIRKGTCDYLIKPVAPLELLKRISQRAEEVRVRYRATRMELELIEASSFQGIVGRSPKILEVIDRVRRIAPHFRSVLLFGETGTGKELVARALHNLSPASAGPFVACNCSAVVETLFESELFGYVQGAFTGAQQDKLGLLEYAHGGPCCSTRSATCRSGCSRNSCGCCKTRRSCGSGRPFRARSTSGLWRRRIGICERW